MKRNTIDNEKCSLNSLYCTNPGSDIMEGNRTLTLALVWQLMRAYTLALLSQLNSDNTPIVESEIIAWANNKLNEKGVTIRHFQDKVIDTYDTLSQIRSQGSSTAYAQQSKTGCFFSIAAFHLIFSKFFSNFSNFRLTRLPCR